MPRGADPGGRTAAVVKFHDEPLVSSHVAFVLDASGSISERDAAGAKRHGDDIAIRQPAVAN